MANSMTIQGQIHKDAQAYFARQIKVREIVSPFLAYFDAISGDTSHEANTTVDFVLLKPREFVQDKFGFDREIVLATTPYQELQPRFFQSVERFMESNRARGRIDPLILFVVSDADNRDEAIDSQRIDATQARMIVTFSAAKCATATDAGFIER